MKRILLILLFAIAVMETVMAQGLYVHYSYMDIKQRKRIDVLPTKIQPTDGWYILDIENLCMIDVSTTGNEGSYKDYFEGRYRFVVFPEDLGEQVKPIKDKPYTQISPSCLPWSGDYHIEIAEDLSVAVFSQTSPFLKPGYPLILSKYFKGQSPFQSKDYEFDNLDDYIYTIDVLGNDKILAGEKFHLHTIVPCKNYSCSDLIMHNEKYLFDPSSSDCCLTEDFEGTIRVTHDGQYGTPMTVEFIPLGGGTTSADEIEMETAAPRYYNLQGVEVANPGAGVFIEVKNGNSRLVKH